VIQIVEFKLKCKQLKQAWNKYFLSFLQKPGYNDNTLKNSLRFSHEDLLNNMKSYAVLEWFDLCLKWIQQAHKVIFDETYRYTNFLMNANIGATEKNDSDELKSHDDKLSKGNHMNV
jgi:hypothetical protein